MKHLELNRSFRSSQQKLIWNYLNFIYHGNNFQIPNIDMLLINWQTLAVVHSNIFQHPRYQPANPERVLKLFDRILLFESILYVLIKITFAMGWLTCKSFWLLSWTLLLLVNKILILTIFLCLLCQPLDLKSKSKIKVKTF